MGKRRRLRKSDGGQLEINRQDLVASDEAILPNVAVSDEVILPYIAGGDESSAEPHVVALDVAIVQQITVASDAGGAQENIVTSDAGGAQENIVTLDAGGAQENIVTSDARGAQENVVASDATTAQLNDAATDDQNVVASDQEIGPELETEQASQALALICPPNLARKDKEWTKIKSKWKCKVHNCIVAYCAKWLLIKHLKEVHGLVAEKSKPGRPSIAAGGPRHQDHAKMNARILGNAMAVQRRNDQKVVSRACAKSEHEWNHLVTLAKQCPPFPKPPLVRFASEQLLKMLGLNAWGMGSVARDVIVRMEKDDDLHGMIRSTRCAYARQLKTAWDVKNWERESSKTSWTK